MSHHRWMTRMGGRIGVWMYRRTDGRLASGSRRVHVLLLTSPGRRSGMPRSVCVRYLETPQGLVVWGTGSGSPRDPDWFENLRRTDVTVVQVRDRVFRVAPRELLDARRDEIWEGLVLARAPEVLRYARRAGRVIPVALLEPLEPSAPGGGKPNPRQL